MNFPLSKMARIRRFLSAAAYYIYNNFVTHFPSYKVRHWYLQHIFQIKIGKSSSVHMGCFITGKNITIGNHSVINRRCYLDGRIGIVIGDNVSISPEVYIVSLTHDPQDELFQVFGKPVVLEDYVWIGARALLIPGVTLGKGCIVGAGSVVTKSFDKFLIIAGVPANCIGKRNEELKYQLTYFPLFDTDIQ